MKTTLWVLVLLGVFACDGGSKPAPAAGAEATKAEPKSPSPAAAESGPKLVAGAEEWLLWYDTAEGVRTRWYTVNAEGTAAVTAERKALVVASAEEMWLIKRKDAALDVQDCLCLDEDEGSPLCTTNGHVQSPGLVAQPMSKPASGSGAVVLHPPSQEVVMGEVFELSLALRGGVGTRLFAEVGDAGFYCGAHPLYEYGYPILDPTAAKPAQIPTIDLPRMLRKNAAAAGMFDSYRACEDDTTLTLDRFVDEVLTVSDVAMSLRAGRVALTWELVAPVIYACSADGLIHGQARTGLLPAGEALGLSGPAAPSLTSALADLGAADVVGWSTVSREGAGRTDALAWFSAVDETPWPASVQVEVEAGAATAPADKKRAGRELTRGRKLTAAGEYAAAVAALDAAIAADATLARAWAARGYARLLDHKLDEAQADSERALELGGSDRFKAAVYFNLGQVELARGDAAAAKAALKASLALRENKEVRAALDGLG